MLARVLFSLLFTLPALAAQNDTPSALATSDLLVMTRHGDEQEFQRCDYAQRKCRKLAKVSIASLQKLRAHLEQMDLKKFPESEWSRVENFLGGQAEVGGSILVAAGLGTGIVSLPGLMAGSLLQVPTLSAYVVGLSLAGSSLLYWHHSIEKRAKKRSRSFLLSVADDLAELTREDWADGESQAVAIPTWLWNHLK